VGSRRRLSCWTLFGSDGHGACADKAESSNAVHARPCPKAPKMHLDVLLRVSASYPIDKLSDYFRRRQRRAAQLVRQCPNEKAPCSACERQSAAETLQGREEELGRARSSNQPCRTNTERRGKGLRHIPLSAAEAPASERDKRLGARDCAREPEHQTAWLPAVQRRQVLRRSGSIDSNKVKSLRAVAVY
jgi:hypothetical protein